MEPAAMNDPFGDVDDTQRTFVRPQPGRRPGAPTTQAPAVAPGEAEADIVPPERGLNPLVALANRLLMLVPPLRATRHVDDPAAMRDSLAQSVREFVAAASARGIASERVMAARYILCTMIDEAAADTPWGGGGVWARHSLLVRFHNEGEGGEKVFQLMARLAERPDLNRDLLELVWCALALGFEGRYRAIENGQAQLDAVRDKLARIVRGQRGDHAAALAQHWQAGAVARKPAHDVLPLAATAALAGVVLVGAYMACVISLGSRTDAVFARIQALRLTPPVVTQPAPAPAPRLAQYLQPDIKAGLLAVRDEVDRSVVTLRGDGAFAPGSAALLPEREALVGRIADALARLRGNVHVTGHTDDQPIARTARFPSNWHLSQARAETVRDLLVARGVATARVRAEGRADAEPVADNRTPANRAVNRRVEITLFVGAAPDAGTPAGSAGSAR